MRRGSAPLGPCSCSKYTQAIFVTAACQRSQAAVKLANAALQKHKDSQILRVLKGLALQRMDRAKEAFEVSRVPSCPAVESVPLRNLIPSVHFNMRH